MAPHIIRPLRFVLPHHARCARPWLIRLGLFLYDHLGGREILPATCTLDLRAIRPACRSSRLRRGFEYSDCWVDDARLVVLNAWTRRGAGRTSACAPRSSRRGAAATIGWSKCAIARPAQRDHRGAARW